MAFSQNRVGRKRGHSESKAFPNEECDRCGKNHTNSMEIGKGTEKYIRDSGIDTSVCPAFGKLCAVCGKRNHYAVKCRYRNVKSSLSGERDHSFYDNQSKKGRSNDNRQANNEAAFEKRNWNETPALNQKADSRSCEGKNTDCDYCGNRKEKVCAAFGKICAICDKKNHFAVKCPHNEPMRRDIGKLETDKAQRYKQRGMSNIHRLEDSRENRNQRSLYKDVATEIPREVDMRQLLDNAPDGNRRKSKDTPWSPGHLQSEFSPFSSMLPSSSRATRATSLAPHNERNRGNGWGFGAKTDERTVRGHEDGFSNLYSRRMTDESKFNKMNTQNIESGYVSTLTGDDILRSMQEKCKNYTEILDARYPGLRRIVGRLIKSVIPDPINSVGSILIPCQLYNLDNSCPFPADAIGHLDAKHVQRVHSCTICYFTLGGMVNVHRQTECPLLSLVDSVSMNMQI